MRHTLILTPNADGTYKGEAKLPLDNPAGFDVSMKVCEVTHKAIIQLEERPNRKCMK